MHRKSMICSTLKTTPDRPMKRRLFALFVDKDTPDIVDAIAKNLGCKKIDGSGKVKGSTGVMLDKIAQGHLQIVPTTPIDPCN